MFQFMKDRKVRKLSKELNLDIDYIAVRGGTNHCKYIYLKDGSEVWLVNNIGLVRIERNEDGTMKSLNECIRDQYGDKILKKRLEGK